MAKENKIKQIRDLVFGEEIENFDLKIEEIKLDLSDCFEQLNKSISNSEKLIQKESVFARKSLEKTNKLIEEKTQDLNNKIKNQTLKLKERLSKTIELREQFLLNKIVELQVKQVENDKVLNSKIKEVESKYISKSDFSELMLELSLRFNGLVSEDELSDRSIPPAQT